MNLYELQRMKLTNRESQLLHAAACGKTDREISAELLISRDTVSTHWRRILTKFRASSRTECVARYAAQEANLLVDQNESLLNEVKERTEAEARELAQKNILAAITDASLAYIHGRSDLKASMNTLLGEVLALTQSEYGFLGEVIYENGQPYLQEHALTNIAWNKETRELYNLHHGLGLKFKNLETLFGQVMVTGEVVISNDALHDERAGGIPKGHPPLQSFLGIPVYSGRELIGMVGLANRPGGYSEGVVEYLNPLVVTCATFIVGWRNRQVQQALQRQVTETSMLIRDLVDMIPSGILYETPERRIEFVNQTFIEMFDIPVRPADLIGASCKTSAEQDKVRFMDPEGFISRINEILADGKTVRGDLLELKDGRRFERDFNVLESNGTVRGYVWCYRPLDLP